MDTIGKWLAYAVLDFIFLVELRSIGVSDKDFIYWVFAIPGYFGIWWIVEKLDNGQHKKEG